MMNERRACPPFVMYKRYDKYQETHVINAYERCVFDYEDEDLEEHVH